MKRKCQINAIQPITCFQVPIVGNVELNLTTDEIYKCLCSKAEVTEILPDGKMVSLDFTNYNSPIQIFDAEDSTKKESDKEQESEIELVEEPTTQETVDELVKEDEHEEEVTTEVTDEEQESEIELVEEPTTQETVADDTNQNPVKTHEVASRNNYNKSKNYNKQGKNKNKKYRSSSN